MANKFLEQVELGDNERKETTHIVKYFHQSTIRLSESYLSELGRHNYVTPTSYLELINSFRNLLSSKQDETMKAKRRYVVGLEKLAFAASQVCWNVDHESSECVFSIIQTVIYKFCY